MRACIAAVGCVALALQLVAGESWPWPWPKVTTTPAPGGNFSAFEQGVAEALGFKDVTSCITDMNVTAHDLWDASQDYKKGGVFDKAKALEKVADAIEKATVGLAACSSGLHDADQYKQLIKDLRDPRYYSMHNALTLALNTAEDRAQFGAVAAALDKGDYKTAGFELTTVVLTVLENPGIPMRSNGTEATQIALGLAKGLATGVDVECFKDVTVEVPEVVGGVLELWTGVLILKGVDSIFHGLVGIVPTFKTCLADKPQIMALMHELGDLKDPAALAKVVEQNIVDNKLDLSLETASAVLDYRGADWQRFGQDIGKILDKIVIPSTLQVAWPFPSHTTPAPSNESAFGQGVAEALGFSHVTDCVTNMNASGVDFWAAAQDYRQGGMISKAKALMKVSQAVEKVTVGLAACSAGMTEEAKYKQLLKDLQDPRYYTVQNALTLCLNTAEDRAQLGAFATALAANDFKTAGFELTNVILDVIENPGIPSSNGTKATQIALGLGQGLATGVDVACFSDVTVEIPQLVGGVFELWTGVLIVKGVESIFHGLVGIVPTFKTCYAEKPEIMALLHELGDLKDPAGLAKIVGQNILDSKLDLSLETASAVLDYRGGEWQRFGEDIGRILDRILIVSSPKSSDFIVI